MRFNKSDSFYQFSTADRLGPNMSEYQHTKLNQITSKIEGLAQFINNMSCISDLTTYTIQSEMRHDLINQRRLVHILYINVHYRDFYGLENNAHVFRISNNNELELSGYVAVRIVVNVERMENYQKTLVSVTKTVLLKYDTKCAPTRSINYVKILRMHWREGWPIINLFRSK